MDLPKSRIASHPRASVETRARLSLADISFCCYWLRMLMVVALVAEVADRLPEWSVFQLIQRILSGMGGAARVEE